MRAEPVPPQRGRPSQEVRRPSRWRVGAGPLLLLLAAVLLLPAGALAYHRGPLWLLSLVPPRPPGLVLHHSATPAQVQGRPLDSDSFDQSHARRGWGLSYAGQQYHIGYHYIILPDGTVQAGRPEWMPGAHCRGHNDMLGICLVGDFREGRRPPAAQMKATVELTTRLLRKYRLPAAKVYRHSDLAPTACPGESFPWHEFREVLAGTR